MSEPTVETSTEIIVPEIQAFSPDVFDPRKEQLQAIVDEVNKIEADPTKMDKDTLAVVNATKNKLVKVRTTIEKTGKALRDPHTQYNKEVSAYENELIAIIEPAEKRFKEIEVNAKKFAIREERRLTLPEFRAKLDAIGDAIEVTDEELLELDPNQRDAYYNQRLGAKLAADKAALDAKQAEQDAEAKRLEDEKKLAAERAYNNRVNAILQLGFKDIGGRFAFSDSMIVTKEQLELLQDSAFNTWLEEVKAFVAKENVRIAKEAEAKKQADIKAAEEKATKEAQEKVQKEADEKEAKRLADEEAAKKAKEEAEAKEKAELLERQSAEAFQKWKSDNSYNAETDTLIEDQDANGKVTILYREVSRYTHTS